MSIVSTVLVYISLILILSGKSRSQGNYSDIEYENIQDILKENKQKIKEVCKDVEVLNGDIKIKVEKLCEMSEQILENVKRSPQNIKSVRRVFSYYLETTDKILDMYTELSTNHIQSSEMKARLRKIENTLDLTIIAFQQYIEKSMETQVVNLDIEIELLEKTIKMEE